MKAQIIIFSLFFFSLVFANQIFSESSDKISSSGEVTSISEKIVNLSAGMISSPGAPKASSIKKGDILQILDEGKSIGEVEVTKTNQTMGGKKVLIEAKIIKFSSEIKKGMGFGILKK